jgi:uncharacterized repeat protein (TIGR03803 family)
MRRKRSEAFTIHPSENTLTRAAALLVVCILAVANAPAQSAQTFVVHRFNPYPSGANPQSGVILSLAGNFYGTTTWGGVYNAGVVYKVDASGQQTLLHEFAGGTEGGNPTASLIADTSGNLYGTAGGAGRGVVYEIENTGQYKVLHSFAGADGSGPQGTLTLDSQGNLYGTTFGGGAHGLGVVFEISPSGTETVLYSFTGKGTDGSNPQGNLVLDKAGNLYGTTSAGGNDGSGSGTLFKVDTAGNETTLHEFTNSTTAAEANPGLVSDGKGTLYGTANYRPTGGILWTFGSSGFHVLEGFTSGEVGAVTLDKQGDIYGTTTAGLVYQITTAGSYSVIYQFTNKLAPGNYLNGNLAISTQGNLYGTTELGGSNDVGVLFEITPAGEENVLYSFPQGTDGCLPLGPLITDGLGDLFGVTSGCGASGQGTVYEIDAKGVETVLYAFQGGSDGAIPNGGLFRDASGNLYGTTISGGANNYGTAFKLNTAGQETILHSFAASASDGSFPNGSLIGDANGNLYGTTAVGGAWGQGTVFELDSAGNESVLYSFTGLSGGGDPLAGLIRDRSGNLYGTAYSGGPTGRSGPGVVYKLESTGVEKVLYAFGGQPDAAGPESVLTADSSGDLFGTTYYGGSYQFGYGAVFKIDSSGTEDVLYSFNITGGEDPTSGVILDSAGNLYGTAPAGGSSGTGVVYMLDPSGAETILHNFTGILDDAFPSGSLLAIPGGILYGTALGQPVPPPQGPTPARTGEVFAIKLAAE